MEILQRKKKSIIQDNDNDDSENINYGMILKANGFSQNLNNNDLLVNKNRNNNNNIVKAEYIPSKFNFVFFNPSDQGVKKTIDRNDLPFRVKPETKYLIEKREGYRYDDNYLNGPFPSFQNIVELSDIKRNITNVFRTTDKALKSKNRLISNNKTQNFKNKNEIDNNNYIISNTEEKDFIQVKK